MRVPEWAWWHSESAFEFVRDTAPVHDAVPAKRKRVREPAKSFKIEGIARAAGEERTGRRVDHQHQRCQA